MKEREAIARELTILAILAILAIRCVLQKANDMSLLD
jgi:hypothetical protein